MDSWSLQLRNAIVAPNFRVFFFFIVTATVLAAGYVNESTGCERISTEDPSRESLVMSTPAKRLKATLNYKNKHLHGKKLTLFRSNSTRIATKAYDNVYLATEAKNGKDPRLEVPLADLKVEDPFSNR